MRRVLPVLLLLLAPLLQVGTSLAKERGQGETYRNEKVMKLAEVTTAHKYPGRTLIRGTMQAGYRFSAAELIRPDGRAVVLPDVKITADRFEVPVRFAKGKGIYRLELKGTTERDRTHSGARILLFAGVPEDHPDEPTPEDVKPDRRLPGEALAADLFHRVNAYRKQARLKALTWHEPIAQAARRHAAECVRRKKLDHTFPGFGTIAAQARKRYGFKRLIYKGPTQPPTRDLAATSRLSTLLEARRGLEPVLHRWARFPAFCLPMTSPLMTHAACGIARTPKGSCYIVFVCVQINGTQIDDITKGLHASAVREVTHNLTTDEERPGYLRALGLWLTKKARKLGKKYATSKDVELRAAAWDVLLLTEPASTRAAIERDLEAAGRAFGSLSQGARPNNRMLALVLAARNLRYAPDLLDKAIAVLKAREAAATRALAFIRAPGSFEEESKRTAALARFPKDWPGTKAAAEANPGS